MDMYIFLVYIVLVSSFSCESYAAMLKVIKPPPLHTAWPKHEAAKLTELHYLNILQTMDQAVHIVDLNATITHWFCGAEKLYGYTAAEAVGQNSVELLAADTDCYPLAFDILRRCCDGETWTGRFHVKSKSGEKFDVIVTDSPLYDDSGCLYGIVVVSARVTPFPKQPGLCSTIPSLDPRILLSLSNLAANASNNVKSKMLSRDDVLDRGDALPSVFGVFFQSGSNVHSKSRLQSAPDSKGSDYDILWEELEIGGEIGHGCCGTVYRGLWNRSDVAIKVFSQQEFSEDLILSFKEEVSLMMRLRHPNILLFMGSVTSSTRLCIVTEYLPRGSLFKLLHKSGIRLDWKRRVRMALDIARGMNYLHHYEPPIVHRDLKSANLLVDNNWNVKVGDFGLSRLKRETFIKTMTAKGTPQWMAPEVIRAEPSNEKSDVYSFGVILWELATQKLPWDDYHTMQVVGGVGFMERRLDIPEDVDPQWAALIRSCWQSDPQLRPTFEELLEKLKVIYKQCVFLDRSAPTDSSM